jgi:fimbrial isopeptide formation D2 family protein
MNRATTKTLRVLFALGLLSLMQLVRLSPSAQAQTAVNLCAVPGKDGVDNGLVSIVNSYYPGPASDITVNRGSTSIPVGLINAQGNQTTISNGDLLLIIQMQDADINFSDTAAYGSGNTANNGSGSTAINQTGLYEYVIAQNAVGSGGGSILIQGAGPGGGLINSYRQQAADITAHGKKTYQVVRVPQFISTTLTGTIRSPGSWNGSSGGIVAIDVANTLTFAGGTIEVQDKGFRGGGGTTNTDTYPEIEDEAFRTDGDVPRGGVKGEGIAGTPLFVFDGTTTTNTNIDGYPRLKSGDTYTTIGTTEGGSRARGAPGNAGGGGDQHNAGGGGGGNGGVGGNGGNSINPPPLNEDIGTGISKSVGGRGGSLFPATPNRIVMGGGGGAGDANNGVAGSGGLGGGIVIIRAGTVTGTGAISARAKDGSLTPTDDGGSGAGAGGTILIMAKSGSLSGVTLNANGGKGGDTNTANADIPYDFGPGGGGGGGVILSSVPIGSATVSGGQPGGSFNGQYKAPAGVPRGATAGADGQIVSGLSSPQIPGILSGADCIRTAQGFKSVKLTNDADNSATISPGDTLIWTVSYVNTNSSSINNFQITDKLPAEVTIASTGGQTITVNAAQGTAPALNSGYTGVGSNTLVSSPITLQPGGAITVSIPVTINATTPSGTVLSNQATANGDGLLQALKSDNVDQTTTSLPSGATVPVDSVLQTQTAGSLDPTTAKVVTTRDYVPSPYQGKIVINEVLYNQSGADSAAANDEFIELYNASSEAVDLTGWKLLDGNLIASDTDGTGSITGSASPFVFGSSTFTTSGTPILQPGKYAIIWVGNQLLPLTSPSITNALGPDVAFQAWLKQSPSLNNSGDDVWLYDSQTKIVDYMSFGTNNAINTRPPTTLNLWDIAPKSLTSGKGQSISLTPNGRDSNTSSCWEPTTSSQAANRCPGFLLTRDTDPLTIPVTPTNPVTPDVNRVTSVGENNNGPVATSPNVLLVKRITKLNNLSTNPNDGTPLNTFVDDPNSTQDNNFYWPTVSGGSFLLGAMNGGLVKPTNEVEYTIYFLSTGTAKAKSVQICDRIPRYQTFVPDAFNSLTAAPNTTPASPAGDRGISVFQGSTTSPDTIYGYTNVGDGDAARYYPPGSILPSACTQPALAEDNGSIVVNLGDLPNATTTGTPKESYGFLRFRTKVK